MSPVGPQEGDSVELEFTVTQDEMERYRDLSGDTNPMHWDRTFAKERGMEGPVVYGGLLVAQVSRLIGGHLPGPGAVIASMNLGFHSPLYVNQSATLTATVGRVSAATHSLEIGLVARRVENIIFRGSALVVTP